MQRAFKIHADVAGTTSLHRFRGTFSLIEFVDVVADMVHAPAGTIRITYKDEEGDTISVTSELEWQERLEQNNGEGVVGLHVAADGKVVSSGLGSDFEATSSYDCADAPVEAAPAATVEESGPAEAEGEENEKNPADEVRKAVQLKLSKADAAILKLVSEITGADAELILTDEAYDGRFDQFITREMVGSEEATIAARKEAIYKACLEKSNELLDAGNIDGAEDLLLKTGAVFPRDAMIDYNLCCCCAMGKRHERSVFYLEQAVENGFKKAAVIMNEPDLASICTDMRVKRIIDRLNGVQVSPSVMDKECEREQEEIRRAIHASMCFEDKTETEQMREAIAESLKTNPPTSSYVTVKTEKNISLKEKVRRVERAFPQIEHGLARRMLKANNEDLAVVMNILAGN